MLGMTEFYFTHVCFFFSVVGGGPRLEGAADGHEDLHRLQTLLYAALLECSFDQDGER